VVLLRAAAHAAPRAAPFVSLRLSPVVRVLPPVLLSLLCEPRRVIPALSVPLVSSLVTAAVAVRYAPLVSARRGHSGRLV
jgi:hypothetical protein